MFATGSVTALQGTSPWTVTGFPTTQNVSGSVFATGSVAALQGTNPWVITNSSVMLTAGVNAIGSVATLQGTNPWQVNHVGSGSIFVGFRNDAVASTVGADLTSRLVATDSAGRILYKPYVAEESTVRGVSSTVNTISTSLIAAQGAGLRTYLTNAMIANTGSVATLVSFQDGDNSVIGRTIAPGGGGSNIVFPVPLRTNGFNQQIHYTAGTAVSILHVSGYGYKAP